MLSSVRSYQISKSTCKLSLMHFSQKSIDQSKPNNRNPRPPMPEGKGTNRFKDTVGSMNNYMNELKSKDPNKKKSTVFSSLIDQNKGKKPSSSTSKKGERDEQFSFKIPKYNTGGDDDDEEEYRGGRRRRGGKEEEENEKDIEFEMSTVSRKMQDFEPPVPEEEMAFYKDVEEYENFGDYEISDELDKFDQYASRILMESSKSSTGEFYDVIHINEPKEGTKGGRRPRIKPIPKPRSTKNLVRSLRPNIYTVAPGTDAHAYAVDAWNVLSHNFWYSDSQKEFLSNQIGLRVNELLDTRILFDTSQPESDTNKFSDYTLQEFQSGNGLEVWDLPETQTNDEILWRDPNERFYYSKNLNLDQLEELVKTVKVTAEEIHEELDQEMEVIDGDGETFVDEDDLF